MDRKNIKVSVLTTAYNHGPYIVKCIESILCQKTDFTFELIIHDDASTDGTAETIRKYAEKFPDVITAICQTENQYSKGVDVYSFILPRAHGKYLAVCEGDDYWCNENKLQKQVDWMEAHPVYSACVHNTKRVDLKNGEEKIWFSTVEDQDLQFEQLLEGGSSCYHTSSLLMRADVDVPEMMREIRSFGDYPLALSLALQGKIRYFADVMSVYRYFTPGSWSMGQSRSSEARIQRCKDNLRLMQIIDEITDHKYAEITEKVSLRQQFCINEESGLYHNLKRGELRRLYQKLPVWRRINIAVKQYMPEMFNIYKKIKMMRR